MAKVTSAEFRNAFGRYREIAQGEPVTVTHRGHDSLVVIAADEYRRLKAYDRQVLFACEISESDLDAIAEAGAPREASAFNHEVPSA